MTTEETTQLDKVLENCVTEDTYTCYRVAKVFNAVLSHMDLDKQIRPQMVYNYDTNGLIVKGKKNVRKYGKSEVRSWIKRYVQKNF